MLEINKASLCWQVGIEKVGVPPCHLELSCLGVWGLQMVIILFLVQLLGSNPSEKQQKLFPPSVGTLSKNWSKYKCPKKVI